MINLSIIINFSVVAVSLLIAAITFWNNRKEVVNKRFVLMQISLSLWIITLQIFYNTTSEEQLLTIGRVNFATGTLVASFLLLFASIYTSNKDYLSNRFRNIYNVITLVIVLLTIFTDLIGENEELVEGEIITTFGSLYLIYILHLFLSFIYAIFILIKKYLRSSGKFKYLLRNLFVVFGITVFWVLTTNIILPLLGIFEFQEVGPFGTVIFTVYIFYSIIRHQFLDVRFIIGKLVFYATSSVLPYFIFFLMAYIYETAYGTSLTPTAYILGLPISFGFVILFSKTNFLLKNYTDSRLINPGYDPLEEADELNKKLSSTVDLAEIANITTNKIATTIRPAYQAIFVIPEDQEKSWLSYAYKDQKLLNPEGFKKVLNIWARLNNTPLLIDEFSSLKIDPHEPIAVMLKELSELMQKEKIKVIYPLLQNEQIVGMMLLGEKEADSPYPILEIDFLDSIANTLGLAIGKSLLYQELRKFNEELQKRVEEATEELKVKNTSLEQTLAELENKRRQERDMVDVMGHELRTPISIARNALAILTSKYDKNNGEIEKEKLGKYLTMAVEATRREITLLETLLSATKLEGNRIQLNLTKVSVDKLIENTLEAHKYKVQEKSLNLNVEKPDGLFIYADKVRTQEIIDNFVSNAVKYTATGSVTIKVYKKGEFIRFDIVDTGIGIAQKDLDKLGGKFFRARKLYGEDTAEDYVHPSGTGLGLFVTFELIHLMGGNREILSEVGKGSTFAAELPEFTGQEDQHLDQTFMEMGNTNVGASSSDS